jgi:hypothetical protein
MGGNHEAYLWQYGKPGGETVFDFCLHRGCEGPKRFLEKWEAPSRRSCRFAFGSAVGVKVSQEGSFRMGYLQYKSVTIAKSLGLYRKCAGAKT